MTNVIKKSLFSFTAIATIFGGALVNVSAANAETGDLTNPLSNKSYEYDKEFGTQCLTTVKSTINHPGQDLVANNGTAIKSIADGVVYKIEEPSGTSNPAKIVIKHNIDGKTYYSVYKNMWEPYQYAYVGMNVSKGQKIAEVGRSGASVEPHLYFEIWKDFYSSKGERINPTTFLKKQGVDLKTQASKKTTTKNPAKCTYYTTTTVNIRANANSSSKIIATVPKQAAVTSTPKTSNESGAYIKVSYKGKVGWVSKSYTSPEYDNSRLSAVKLATSSSYETTEQSRVTVGDSWGVKKAKPEYVAAKRKAMKNTGTDPMTNLYASCDRFVATVSRNTMDTKIPWGSTSTQQSYLSNSSQWKRYTKKSDAQPGDIFVTKKNGHVMIYLGQVNGVDSVAHASYLSRVAGISSATYLTENLVDRSGRAYYGYHYIGKKKAASTGSSTKIAANVKYTVTKNVNFRTGPSTKYKVIKTLKKNDKVISTGKVSGSWYQVKSGSKTGWVSKSYIKKTASASTGSSTKTKTTTANVNMRTGASTKYKVIKNIKKGTKVSLTGKKSGNWYQVKVSSKTGWISGSYLK